MRKVAVAVVISLVLPFVGSPVRASATSWLMGYYAIYARDRLPPDSIEWSGLTHIAVAAVVPRADGTLDTSFYWDATNGPAMAKDIAARARNHGVTPLLMVGGEGTHDAFAAALANNGATLERNLRTAMRDLGYDGLDLDLEPITPTDRAPLAALIDALRANAPSAVLTLPVNWVNTNQPDAAAWYGQVASKLDRENVMTWAMAGAWDGWQTWHSSALKGQTRPTPSSVVTSVKAYRRAGVPAGKLGVGVAFYGQCWNGGVTGPRQTVPEGGGIVAADNTMSYTNILTSYYDASAYHWDDTARAPYLGFASPAGPAGCTYVSYENARSIKAKGNWARNNALGGAIVWNINEGPGSLLRQTRAAFGA